jgi:hypothetical protein
LLNEGVSVTDGTPERQNIEETNTTNQGEVRWPTSQVMPNVRRQTLNKSTREQYLADGFRSQTQ